MDWRPIRGVCRHLDLDKDKQLIEIGEFTFTISPFIFKAHCHRGVAEIAAGLTVLPGEIIEPMSHFTKKVVCRELYLSLMFYIFPLYLAVYDINQQKMQQKLYIIAHIIEIGGPSKPPFLTFFLIIINSMEFLEACMTIPYVFKLYDHSLLSKRRN